MTGGELILGQSVFEWLSMYGYYIFPVIIIFLGPVGGFAGGVFASLGALNPFVLFVIWFFTTTGTDALLFALGKFGRNILNKFKWSRRVVQRIHDSEHSPDTTWVNVIKEHYIKLFFFIKISPTVSLSDTLAVIGGLLNVEFKRHYIASVMGQIIWSGTFISLGFYFGGAIQDVNFLINTTGIVLGVFLVFAFLYVKFIHRRVMNKFGNVIIFLKSIFPKFR